MIAAMAAGIIAFGLFVLLLVCIVVPHQGTSLRTCHTCQMIFGCLTALVIASTVWVNVWK